MNNPIFTYNQDEAVKAGQTAFISETGAYNCKIISAEWIQSQGGAQAIEFSVETDEGLKGNYLTVYYTKKTGEKLEGGHSMIQAIMGCTGVQQLSQQFNGNKAFAPELAGKKVGLMLQKVLRLKQDGSETYAFSIICPFSVATRKTLSEHLENRPAERIDYLIAHTKDKDERAKQNNHGYQQQQGYQAQNQFYGQPAQVTQAQPQSAPPVDNFEDDIPF
ncbi:hypothetical protein A1D22_05980 [Pasteurellaceae bacterium LFhippo2]|nr:hypothetical protein [Pasteurellaceae bacterium LFhippo2]